MRLSPPLAVLIGAAGAHAIYLRAWEVVFPAAISGPSIIDREHYGSFLPNLANGVAVDHHGRIWKTTFKRYWEPTPTFN